MKMVPSCSSSGYVTQWETPMWWGTPMFGNVTAHEGLLKCHWSLHTHRGRPGMPLEPRYPQRTHTRSSLISNSPFQGPCRRPTTRVLRGGAVSSEQGTPVTKAVMHVGVCGSQKEMFASMLPLTPLKKSAGTLQGYLAHMEKPPSLGPPYGPKRSLTVRS